MIDLPPYNLQGIWSIIAIIFTGLFFIFIYNINTKSVRYLSKYHLFGNFTGKKIKHKSDFINENFKKYIFGSNADGLYIEPEDDPNYFGVDWPVLIPWSEIRYHRQALFGSRYLVFILNSNATLKLQLTLPVPIAHELLQAAGLPTGVSKANI